MEVIDLSHTEVVKIDENAFAECVALADISFPSTIPTFGVKVFDRCTELSRTMETLDNEKVFAFFQDQASSLPFSYFARSPVSALDDLKTLPPPAVPFRRMASGDTPLHCACRNLNPANFPSIIEHVRQRARARICRRVGIDPFSRLARSPPLLDTAYDDTARFLSLRISCISCARVALAGPQTGPVRRVHQQQARRQALRHRRPQPARLPRFPVPPCRRPPRLAED